MKLKTNVNRQIWNNLLHGSGSTMDRRKTESLNQNHARAFTLLHGTKQVPALRKEMLAKAAAE